MLIVAKACYYHRRLVYGMISSLCGNLIGGVAPKPNKKIAPVGCVREHLLVLGKEQPWSLIASGTAAECEDGHCGMGTNQRSHRLKNSDGRGLHGARKKRTLKLALEGNL